MRGVVILALALAAAPASAATLRVESASVVFPDATPGTPGRIQLTATFTGLTLDTRSQLRFGVGGNTRWVTLQADPGRVLSARSGTGHAMSIDFQIRRLTATEVDVLPSRENPVAVELRQGSTVACTMIQMTEGEGRWTFAGAGDRQFPCILREAPGAEPSTVTAGVETKVRFHVGTGSSLRPDKGGLRVVRVGDGAAAPVCQLRDSGRAEDGDARAGDGVFSCTASMTETAAGSVRFRAEGTYGGERIASPSVALEVRAAE
jgi:hypothetical protein